MMLLLTSIITSIIISFVVFIIISFVVVLLLFEIKRKRQAKAGLPKVIGLPKVHYKVTKEEAEKIWSGRCPCGGQLLAGPRGGAAQNVKCEVCEQKFNVPPRPFLPERIC